jgi:nucleotide-binding universal stress UspA family protein
MSGTILVGVDEHEQAHDAVALGGALAEALGDDLAVVHVYPLEALAWRGVGGHRVDVGRGVAVGVPGQSPLRDEAKRIVMRAIEGRDAATLPLVVPDTSTVAGLHYQAARTGAEMLVLGSSRHGPAGQIAFGSHVASALHGAPCAVAVAPRGLAGSGWTPATIAVAYDGSEEADHALELARRLAASTGARVRLIAVVEMPPLGWGRYNYRPNWEAYARDARGTAAEALDQAAAEGEETGVRIGADAAKELLAAASEADLMVMGSRAYGPVRRVMAGSVARRVMRDAPCPVIVVPRGAHERLSAPEAAVAAPA